MRARNRDNARVVTDIIPACKTLSANNNIQNRLHGFFMGFFFFFKSISRNEIRLVNRLFSYNQGISPLLSLKKKEKNKRKAMLQCKDVNIYIF